MANATPADSRYVPLTQQKYCCVPTCLLMVMNRHNIPLMSAEELGYQLGLTVPEKDAHLFWNARTGNRPPSGWGTQIQSTKYSPNALFSRLRIALLMSQRLIDTFSSASDLKRYLQIAQDTDLDVLLCFQYGALFNTDSDSGHVCVFDRIEGDMIRLIDPERDVPKWREVEVERLFESMVKHGPDKTGGCLELRAKPPKLPSNA